MSALSSIESWAATAVDRGPARSDASGGERHLRVVRGSAQADRVAIANGSIAAVQPRSSSIRPAANRQRSIATGQFPTGPLPAGPILTGPILTGTVVAGRERRFGPGASSPMSSAPVRLTRRGRIVVAVLLVAALSVAVLLVTTLVSGRAQATNHGAPRAAYQGMHQVVVRPGQTLWSIAAAADPAADPRNIVQEIMSANALGSPDISAGELLWVP